jgi:hypothetical protein
MTTYLVDIQDTSCRCYEINDTTVEGDRGGMMAH